MPVTEIFMILLNISSRVCSSISGPVVQKKVKEDALCNTCTLSLHYCVPSILSLAYSTQHVWVYLLYRDSKGHQSGQLTGPIRTRQGASLKLRNHLEKQAEHQLWREKRWWCNYWPDHNSLGVNHLLLNTTVQSTHPTQHAVCVPQKGRDFKSCTHVI